MSVELALSGSISQDEGTAASGTPYTFTVTRTGDLSGTTSVNYQVTGTGSSPVEFADFSRGVIPSGSVTFSPGEQTKVITIGVTADTLVEGSENFVLTLSGASAGASITSDTATGTIVEDDIDDGILGVEIYAGSSFGTGGSGSSTRFGSTDPTDIAYNPVTGGFYLVDSEVDEAPFRSNINMFKLNGQAQLQAGISLRSFTSEPTGVAVWVTPSGAQHLFICDDNGRRIYEVDAANPTTSLRSFSTTGFGCQDPEDLSINPLNGNLFVLSENDHRIYEITQSGALVSTVYLPDTLVPIVDPNMADSGAEALAYDPVHDVFYVAGGFTTDIYVVSRAGEIIDTIDVLSDYPNNNGLRVYPKGLELAPSSDDPNMLSLWVTDYGLDQVADGRLIEIKLDQPVQPLPSDGQALNGTSGNDNLQATSGERWIIDGLAGNDTITTLGGNDIIRGGVGDDIISAGAGDDLIQFKGTGLGFDNVDGGDGIDRIEAGAKGTQIGLKSVSNVELISANGFASVSILGSSAGDTLDFTNVRLVGIGSINGAGGNDFIFGSSSADAIRGAAGADTLRGNGGADRFVFTTIADTKVSAPDKILDFQHGVDKLDLGQIDAVSTAGGNQAFTFIGESAFTNHAGQLRVDTTDPNKTLVLGDIDGNGVADFAIELSAGVQLSSGDFIL